MIPQPKLIIELRVVGKDKTVLERSVFEGEADMSQQMKDRYATVVGDAKGRVTVSRELSESDYGSGGKVFISISLVCDQSETGINEAVHLATHLSNSYVEKHHSELKDRLIALGIFKKN